MKRLRFPRSRAFLFFVPLFLALLLVGQGAPGLARAQQAEFSDFACWATGPFPSSPADDPGLSLEPQWGNAADEFVVDLKDLGGDVLLTMDLEADYLGSPHDPSPDFDDSTKDDPHEEPVYTLFDSMPELVDYTFGFDFLGTPPFGHLAPDTFKDRRFIRMMDKLIPGTVTYPTHEDTFKRLYPEEDRRYLLPWDTLDDYLNRRSVATPYKNAVRSFYGQWIDPANPGGGRAVDFVDLARDQAANRLEALEGVVTAAGDGGVVHYGTIEAVAQEFTFQADENCSGNSCSGVTQISSQLVPVTFHTSVREQNDGQTYRNVTEAGDRGVRVMDGVDGDGNPVSERVEQVDFDLSRLPPSTLHLRDPASGGYYRRHQENTGSDQLHVTLSLNDRYRRDITFDPDSGPLYDERGLPAMGLEPWTYDRIAGRRDPDLNEWFRKTAAISNPDLTDHQGYRQPSLSLPYWSGSKHDPFSDRTIRWPVNLEDLNWYLYRLPSTGYRDPLWHYWVSDEGRRRLVTSAYGRDPVPFPFDGDISGLTNNVPTCSLPGEERQYPASGYRSPLNIDAIECENLDGTNLVDWRWPQVWGGTQSGVNLPFDSPARPPGVLTDDFLVKQGVESADDSRGPIGTRRLNRFDFVIYESERMGDLAPGDRGYDAERRYGIPRREDARNGYLDNWAFEPVDPNMPHLLVVTFYEARTDEKLVDFRYAPGVDDDAGSRVFSLPKRRLQRVVCRMFVHPSGNWPGESMVRWLSENLFAKIKTFFTEIYDGFTGWIEKIVNGIAESPLNVMRKTTGMVCDGIGKVDELTELDGPVAPQSVLRDPEGRVRINSAYESKLEGQAECHQASSPPVSTCERGSEFYFEGGCVHLPEMRLKVREAKFIRPPAPPASPLEYREYRAGLPGSDSSFGERRLVEVFLATLGPGGVSMPAEFLPVADLSANPPDVVNERNSGLTRAFVDWEFRWDSVSEEVHEAIDGFRVYVYPDQKSSAKLVPEGGFGYSLPKIVQASFDEVGLVFYRHYRLTLFTVGGLKHYPDGSSDSDSFFPDGLDSSLVGLEAVGVEHVINDYENFNNLIHNMPLAPGFVHGFEVAAYVGHPGSPDFQEGPRSDRLTLRGDQVACDHVTGPPGDADVEDIRRLYDCGPPATPASLGYADDEFRPGLLALTGSDICTDIFSSTPAGFTWDNPAVKQVWRLVWIIAGGVLFTLLVWQGLRMTYDVWLDPQPAIGFRELVPRFLLAAGLAVSSLFICRLVLVVASDLTCFVAQYTGMSMWGVIGSTFGVLVEGFGSWFSSSLGKDTELLARLGNFMLMFLFGNIVVLVLLFILYLFLKVLFGMLLRIALLAVLIAFAPLAFAFYASDATSHWTKKWVSMFLGATFQQVVVLVVIYLGISIMRHYFTAGAESGGVTLIVGMILSFVTLSLAASVPDIVNPGGKGVFSAFGQMAQMVMTGAVVAATAGIGALAGGAMGAFGGGGTSAAAPAGSVTLGSTGGGGASAPAGGAAPPAAGGGNNLISSVNRSPTGPSGGPSGGQPSAPGGPSGGQPPAPGGLSGGPSGGQPSAPSGPSGGQPSAPGGQPSAPGGQPSAPGGQPSDSTSRPQGSLLRRIARGAFHGARTGARRGARFNTMAADMMAGNSFYSHGSRSDDTARREKETQDRASTRASYDRLSGVLDRIDARLGGGQDEEDGS